MVNDVISKIIQRDLLKLKTEIELYKDESNLWKVKKNIANSAGNLCLHIVGNLNTYIGATLGQTDYVRDRDAEFELKNVPRNELIKQLEETIKIVNQVMPTLTDEIIHKEYPLLVLKEKTSTEYFLIHLATHLGYHLGQVNYHRRLID